MKGTLYLIPNTLGDSPLQRLFPPYNRDIVCGITQFIVEETRSARRFLASLQLPHRIETLQFYELNEHTAKTDAARLMELFLQGDVGLLSEAGVPGVADPGSEIVKLAHMEGIRVVPLVGPSSILLAMMASGMNGQNFAFAGYLPVKKEARAERIKQLEKRSAIEGQSQIFIETPYRNNALLEELLRVCLPSTRICVAADLTLETEFIRTATRAEWKKGPLPDLHKRPTIWVLSTE